MGVVTHTCTHTPASHAIPRLEHGASALIQRQRRLADRAGPGTYTAFHVVERNAAIQVQLERRHMNNRSSPWRAGSVPRWDTPPRKGMSVHTVHGWRRASSHRRPGGEPGAARRLVQRMRRADIDALGAAGARGEERHLVDRGPAAGNIAPPPTRSSSAWQFPSPNGQTLAEKLAAVAVLVNQKLFSTLNSQRNCQGLIPRFVSWRDRRDGVPRRVHPLLQVHRWSALLMRCTRRRAAPGSPPGRRCSTRGASRAPWCTDIPARRRVPPGH